MLGWGFPRVLSSQVPRLQWSSATEPERWDSIVGGEHKPQLILCVLGTRSRAKVKAANRMARRVSYLLLNCTNQLGCW